MKVSEILILNKQGTKKQVKKRLKNKEVVYNGHILSEDIEITTGILACQGQLMDLQPLKYLILNKPLGYECTAQSRLYHSVEELLPIKHLHYVGRLDQNTSGLLLVTNDLKLRKKLILPVYHVAKTYAFTCLHPLSLQDLECFKQGIVINGSERCASAQVVLEDVNHGLITLHEGKYHEIRKMFLSLNNKIMTLKRIRFGPLELGKLKEGEVRFLTQEEIKMLKRCVND